MTIDTRIVSDWTGYSKDPGLFFKRFRYDYWDRVVTNVNCATSDLFVHDLVMPKKQQETDSRQLRIEDCLNGFRRLTTPVTNTGQPINTTHPFFLPRQPTPRLATDPVPPVKLRDIRSGGGAGDRSSSSTGPCNECSDGSVSADQTVAPGQGEGLSQDSDREGLVLDLSQERSDEGTSSGEDKGQDSGKPEGVSDSPGTAQGRCQTSTRIDPLLESNFYKKPTVFRLCVWQTRQLSDGEEPPCSEELFRKGGPIATAVWGPSEGGREEFDYEENLYQCRLVNGWVNTAFSVEGREDSHRIAIWAIDFKRAPGDRPWILLVEQEEGGGFSIACCSPLGATAKKEVEPTEPSRKLSPDTPYCRLVELEYQVRATFQSTTTLHQWWSQFSQDNPNSFVAIVRDHLRRTEGRRLLRLLLRRELRPGLDGRIQGAEDNPMAEPLPSRGTDDPAEKGVSVRQEGQPANDYTCQLFPRGMLSEGSGEGPEQAGHPPAKTAHRRAKRTTGHVGTRRSSRLKSRKLFSDEGMDQE